MSDPQPPLPGGHKVGEKVFFTGPNYANSKGDKLVHGQQGEVTGPATHESHKGKGVRVRFPGNKGNVECLLTRVRRLGAASAAATSPAPRTRDFAHGLCVPATASAAAPQPSLHAQPLASQPTARVREGWWPRAWCGVAASVAAPERAAAEPYPPCSLRLVAACAGEPRCAAAAAGRLQGG